MAWTWENLLLSCPTCNGSSHKGNYFPVKGAPLEAMDFDLTREAALLVDPTLDDPLDHIRWQPRNPAERRARWGWTPVAVGPKGEETIEAFRMVRSDLTEHVTDIIQREILLDVDDIEHLLRLRRGEEALERWLFLQERSLHDSALFVGAKWCALIYLRALPDSPLTALPEPPRPGHRAPWTPIIGLPPEPDGATKASWKRLLAGEEPDDALIGILKTTPHTAHELHALLKRTHPYYKLTRQALKTKLDVLVAKGLLHVNDNRFEAELTPRDLMDMTQ